jgi:hypothetical protein
MTSPFLLRARHDVSYQSILYVELCFDVQVLNNYVASLTQGEYLTSTYITFWQNEGNALSRVDAELPAYGSLGPLFHAFGLISAEELRSGAGSYISGTSLNVQKRSFAALIITWYLLLMVPLQLHR